MKNALQKILKKFKNKKVLGIHFRGTSYKRSAGHPLPATKKQMFELTNKLLDENDIDNILVTEEKEYLDFFKKKYGNKLIYLKSSYRSNKNDAFKIYPRNLHLHHANNNIKYSYNSRYFTCCSNISSAW